MTTSCRRSSWSSAAGSTAFDGANLAGWLYRITRRQVRDFRRRTWVKHIFTRRRAEEPDVLPARRRRPGRVALERKEEQRVLHALLGKMARGAAHDLRAVRGIEGLSGEEIAPHPERSAQHRLDAAAITRARSSSRWPRSTRRLKPTPRNGERIARWRGRGDERARRQSARRGQRPAASDARRLLDNPDAAGNGSAAWAVGLLRGAEPYRAPAGRKQRVQLRLGHTPRRRRAAASCGWPWRASCCSACAAIVQRRARALAGLDGARRTSASCAGGAARRGRAFVEPGACARTQRRE